MFRLNILDNLVGALQLVSEQVDLVSDLAMSHYNPSLSSTDPLESGLFTLKLSHAESDQLSIVHGRQGITVENRSGPGWLSKKIVVEMQFRSNHWREFSLTGC